ncbi:hypothetical protein BV511_06905 [Methylorubrum extorquens]|uniref:sensor domain-containing diguanylate cyclase n=1 Tax=Methylorubrum extorquens TaxID=408 RepID=UPI0009729046|nr:sensor domain-containing diguanylate cyclase [Methylorubrum extorquens]APX84467.1 hypothetical protein BV511_06905 [Methylorubrum extorquens]
MPVLSPSASRHISVLIARSGFKPPISSPDEAVLPYLNAVHFGLLLVAKDGRVIFCSDQASRLIGMSNTVVREGSSVRQILRALRMGAGSTWQTVRKQLHHALGCAVPTTVQFLLGERSFELGLQPVPGLGWTVSLEDITERRAAEVNAAERARLDPLTELPNRLLLRERLDEALARLRRNAEGCAILLVDLDRFKPVNDTLGHPVGDALLMKVADRLRTTVRPTDTVARIGGDEFVILQTGISDPAAVQVLARRLVDLIGRTYMVEGHLLTIGASVGVAVAPRDGTDADQLLKNADLALYRSKVDGRGTYRFFEPEMDALMQARRRLELDLTGWLWTGLIERISQDRRSRTCGEDRRRARSRSF